VHFTQGKLDEAQSLAEQILRESNELGNRWAGAIMQVLLANIALWRGESEAALKNATTARETFVSLSDAWGELQALTPLVQALNVLGRSTEAMAMLEILEEVASHAIDAGMRRVPALMRVSILIQRGSPDALPLAQALQAEFDDEVFISDEQRTTLGLAQLHHGDVIEALITLNQARAVAGGPGPTAAASVAYASALVAAGQPEEALDVCAATEPIAVTFVDAYRLQIARAFALLRTGDSEGADAALEAATKIVDGTQSRLDQCLVRLARAAYMGATNQPATAAAADALERAGTLGYRPIGWEHTYALMAGTPG
jgi:tetratricopeptide (TPR) repeat protein